MDQFVINGGQRLRGQVTINGSKNAALPLMATALLTDQPVVLSGVPDLLDIGSMKELLDSLGVDVEEQGSGSSGKSSGKDVTKKGKKAKATDADASPATAGHTVRLAARNNTDILAHYDIVRKMRAGICVLGPLLAARGRAQVSLPGGCAIGDRPVNLHLRGLEALGAKIHLEAGYVHAEAPGGRLHGGPVFLGGPNGSTVLGTANVLSAATLARGTTVIESAACEPEIQDLALLLSKMGAKITGAGTPRIIIEGVESLGGAEHAVMPDRIEAGTYVVAAAMTNGEVTLANYPADALMAFHDRLLQVGVQVEPIDGSNLTDSAGLAASAKPQTVRVSTERVLKPTQVTTQPHPGFPTDLQAQMMALLCLADGNSIVTEKIFPERFLHVAELTRMGAQMHRAGNTVMVSGTRELVGAPVMASDLRASAGLVLAGLAARGQTIVQRVYHLDRGYEKMEVTLQRLGADIERVNR